MKVLIMLSFVSKKILFEIILPLAESAQKRPAGAGIAKRCGARGSGDGLLNASEPWERTQQGVDY
jgi:hypothetical protein